MKPFFYMLSRGLPVFMFVSILFLRCESYQEPDIQLGKSPDLPTLSLVQLKTDSNRVVVSEKSDVIFDRLWSAVGASPDRTKKGLDTFYFPKAGRYNIIWSGSFKGGSGTGQQSFSVVIPKDAVTPCTGLATLLAGGCDPTSRKCWTFSKKAGAVAVGPTPGSAEWFTSPLNGLQNEQYDDNFCFAWAENKFTYDNNGLTVDPWNGYKPVPFALPGKPQWQLIPIGPAGVPRIELPEGAFMGVWDASNVYDIVRLTEKEMIVRTPFLKGGGWFELYFEAR
jgi:hypothetical protein